MIAIAAQAAVIVLAPWDIFSDTRQLGLATMILVAALVVGVAVASKVPRDKGPNFFGALAALALVGGLAYMGVEAAGSALWVVILLTVLLGVFGLVA